VYLVDRHPQIRRSWVRHADWRGAREVADLVARQLGHHNVGALLARAKAQAGAEHVVLLIHLERDARSFASRCYRPCGPAAEFAFVLQASGPKAWQGMQYTQAHEALHLFGADDLYPIRDAKFYAPRDIMNYPSRLLAGSTLEPITALATGLRAEPVGAPFAVHILK
jgi:hypothetical protein